MPKIHYNSRATLGQMLAGKERLGELAAFPGTIKSASREELSEKEWQALDFLVERQVREAPKYEVRKPLVIEFSQIEGTSSSLIITNPAEIKRVFEDYGVSENVSMPEGYLRDKAVVVYVQFPADVDNKNKGDIVCFSRPE